MNTSLIDALLTERRGYEVRGLKDRIAAVDAQLKELGYEHKYLKSVETASVEPTVEVAAMSKPRRRKVD